MSFTQIIPGLTNHVEPPVLPLSLVKSETLTVIKNERPEYEIVEDVKGIDIVLHPFNEDSLKSETVPTNMLETKHSKFVEIQSLFIKTENITEDTSDGNGSWGTGQGVVEVQGSNEHFNELGNLQTEENLVSNFSRDLDGISTKSRKAKYPEKIDSAGCYKTDETISWENEKIKVFRASVIPVEPHEYTSLAEDKHVCNHCQHSFKKLKNLKLHLKRIHREVTTMYLCPYCPYKSKSSLRDHIIAKHKSAKDIQWFQCHLCEMKFKLKYRLTRHMKRVHLTAKQMEDRSELCLDCGKRCTHKKREKRCHLCEMKFKLKYRLTRHMKRVHLTAKQMEDRSELCLDCGKRCTHKKREKRHCCEKCAKERHLKYHCDMCDYKTFKLHHLNRHKLIHLKPEEIQYFYCYHCSHKNKDKQELKRHIFRHFRNENVPFYCYICNFMTLKRDLIIKHFKKHPEHHNKYDETIRKYQLETRIKKLEKRYGCDKCNYETYRRRNLTKHKIIHLKPEETHYFCCHHCSFKSKYKENLKAHVFGHFKNENVPFYCYICDFMTLKRHVIIGHLKKHFKLQKSMKTG